MTTTVSTVDEATPAVMTVRQGCGYVGIGETLMRRLIAEKQIPAIRIGRAVRLLRRDLDDFLEKQRTT